MIVNARNILQSHSERPRIKKKHECVQVLFFADLDASKYHDQCISTVYSIDYNNLLNSVKDPHNEHHLSRKQNRSLSSLWRNSCICKRWFCLHVSSRTLSRLPHIIIVILLLFLSHSWPPTMLPFFAIDSPTSPVSPVTLDVSLTLPGELENKGGHEPTPWRMHAAVHMAGCTCACSRSNERFSDLSSCTPGEYWWIPL